jgi:predicted amidophosphoribosyltransferase
MRDLPDCSIAVVDDVVTTGSTLNELARVLRLRGARRITGWTAARTLSDA